jgi:small GTP-binding protein
VAGRAVHGMLADGEVVIDDPVVVVHERGADLSVHGGAWVVRRFLELARKNGFEIVQSRAMPLDEAAVDGEEGVERAMLAHVPLARTELALKCLLAQPAAWKRRSFSALRSDPTLWWLLHPPRLAIVGAPNVGKSTLANQLFAQQRSITEDVPGTTRDWVGEIADINGLAVFLMDTPGLRETTDPIEAVAIEMSRSQIEKADWVMVVVDGEAAIEEQKKWADEFPGALVIRNKCDRAREAGPIDKARPHVYTVGTSRYGVDAVRQAICRHFMRGWRDPRRKRYWQSDLIHAQTGG